MVLTRSSDHIYTKWHLSYRNLYSQQFNRMGFDLLGNEMIIQKETPIYFCYLIFYKFITVLSFLPALGTSCLIFTILRYLSTSVLRRSTSYLIFFHNIFHPFYFSIFKNCFTSIVIFGSSVCFYSESRLKRLFLYRSWFHSSFLFHLSFVLWFYAHHFIIHLNFVYP